VLKLVVSIIKLSMVFYNPAIAALTPSMVVGLGSYHPKTKTPFSLTTFGSNPLFHGLF
jgi:hypothetical protein